MFLPGLKCRQRLLAHHLNHGYLTLGVRLRDFRIDRGIVKADSGGILREIAKVNFANPGPVDCTETHGAGFAGRVQITVPQFEARKFLASLADRQHFRMRRGVVRRRNSIGSLGNDVAVFHDNATERAAASGTDIFKRESNGAGHENVVHVARFRHRGMVKGILISATRESARKSVVMDSFAAAG
jgi:hypothetical protein